ncbi:hypothetical protein D6853_13105 [Butyrivibrio sp. X503]|uniref:DUF6564 domain-containing protein n=1 Tax=Butyrivibrio sp. X503 TaxID=2364878 RepID=UPI000EAA2C6C|nr:DUF6564 domain-containing protein [Butyrivibrio sp. X503]RKM54459.1 hypothetical protein D6853_13105 [Butyrivibrio sp. X503]
MKIAIITNAGISSRFNEGIPEESKRLKAIYYENDSKETLLFHQLLKCSYADKIVLVGGYKYESLQEYVQTLESGLQSKITMVKNDHFEDLGSGYSLYLGLEETFKYEPDEVLFIEGDLDIDNTSFERVVSADKSVLTYTYEPIYANKAVVLYKDDTDRYRYAFNSNHGMLTIESPFSCILNSGQTWKFTETDKLKKANTKFIDEAKGDTNLRIIQNYLDMGVEAAIVPLDRWTNCNTRDDYRKIVSYWENEK